MRGFNTKASTWNPQATSTVRVITMSERDLLEEQRRLRACGSHVAEPFNRPTGDSIPRRAEDSSHGNLEPFFFITFQLKTKFSPKRPFL
jgi:hypothetical protein